MNQDTTLTYQPSQIRVLVILRVLIGWHFLYEGVVKSMAGDWTAKAYLAASSGWFSDIFQGIANNQAILDVVDVLNIWALILIGLALILGAFTRWATLAGIALLALYFLAQPPFIGSPAASSGEGNYLWVNKNLIEMFALAVLWAFPSSQEYGLDRLIFRKK